MVRVFCLFLIFFFAQSTLTGQNPIIDSLKKALSTAESAKDKSDLLHKLASEEWDYDFQAGHDHAMQALELARQAGYDLGQVQALTDLGLHSYFIGDYQAAMTYYNRAIQVAGSNNFGEYPSYTYTRIGNLYRVQARFDSAQFFYMKSLELIENEKAYPLTASSTYYNIGLLNFDLSRYQESIRNIQKSLTLREQMGDSMLMAESWKGLGNVYNRLSEPEVAHENYEKAMQVARRYHNPELEMFCNIAMGELAFMEGNYARSIQLLSDAMEVLKSHNFRRYYAQALHLMGRVYVSQGDYGKALVFFFDALKINEDLKNRQEVARINVTIGWVYNYQSSFQLAIDYANRALTTMEMIKDKDGIALAENLLGNIHFRKGEFATALNHYERSLQLRKEIESPIPIANTVFNIANVYEGQGDFEKALTYLLEAAKVHQRFNSELAVDYNGIGALLIKMKKYDQARSYLKLANELAVANKMRPELRNNHKHMAQLARNEGKYQEALMHYDKFMLLNDSLNSEAVVTRTAQLNALYQLEKKEREIQNLSLQNETKQAQIEAQNSRLRIQNMALYFSIALVLTLAVTAYVLYRYYQSKARANKELSRLNREVQEQKEEIQSQAEELTEAYGVIQMTNKDLEGTVAQRTSQLRQAYKELDTFFYRASHDFRRPLTTLQGLAEVAKVTLKDDSAIELFDKVNETARGVDRMLHKLQSVSLIGSSGLAIEEIQFDVELDFVFEQFRTSILQNKIVVERNINLKEPFRSYPAVIRIIFDNLLENSFQFINPVSPRVSLSIFKADEQLNIVVQDNGEGIAKEFHNRIFDMYFRANEKSKGNGLGLYIVRKAVERLKGSISFESEYGQGTVITVRLPFLSWS